MVYFSMQLRERTGIILGAEREDYIKISCMEEILKCTTITFKKFVEKAFIHAKDDLSRLNVAYLSDHFNDITYTQLGSEDINQKLWKIYNGTQ